VSADGATRLAMVMAGGGARGAYEAGVLRFVLGDLPLRLGITIAPDLITGTSVGAINGVFIGAWLGDPKGAHQLSALWQDLTIGQIYRFEAMDLLRSPFRVLRGSANDPVGLVDASPLHQMLRERVPWTQLHEAIDTHRLQGMVLAATDVVSGASVLFADGEATGDLSTGRSQRIATRIHADHVLASCAIPFVFPPVAIDGHSYVDGGLRQNTPLIPAIRMGATHCLVIGTKRTGSPGMVDLSENDDPSIAFLLGKTLNALLLDPVHDDVKRLELVNEILRAGKDAYGPDFTAQINARLSEPLREVKVLSIRPSEDLGRIAGSTWSPDAIEASRATLMLLSTIAERGEGGEADLLSYMLFDRTFTRPIEQLGYEDAARMESEIVDFLGITRTKT
jgi:NTE family protein